MVGLATFAAFLQISIATPAPALQSGETLLEVSADGEVRAVPDIAEFSIGVVTDASTAKAALAANAAASARLVTGITAEGVADRDMRTSDLAVRPRFRSDKDGDDTDEIVGYRASNRLTVRVRDIARAPALVDAMIAAGANDISGPSFGFASEAPLKIRARADAIAQARQEAADYAAALNMKVSRVLRVSERSARSVGGDDIVVTASRGSAPIRPGEQTINVTVWIDFALTK